MSVFSMNFILYSFLILHSIGCVKIQDADEDKITADPIISVQQKKYDVVDSHWQIVEGDGPNQYEIKLNLNPNTQFIQRYDKGDADKARVLLQKPFNQQFLIDNSAQPGHQFVYELGHFENTRPVIDNSFTVNVPIDFVIKENLNLTSDMDIHDYRRIFVDTGVVIQTNGFLFKISADQLLAPQLTIQSFVKNDIANYALSGKNGGQVQIQLRSGIGILNIEMRGQNGAKGLVGPQVPSDVSLACGTVIIKDDCQPPNYEPNIHDRPKFPQPKEGHSGGQGFPGGNSGSANVIIVEEHKLKINHLLEAGLGGEGGDGGPGQIVARDNGRLIGGFGSDGLRGSNGQGGSFCIKDPETNYCISI